MTGRSASVLAVVSAMATGVLRVAANEVGVRV